MTNLPRTRGRPQPGPAPVGSGRSALALLAGGAALAFVILFVMPAMESPPHLARITIDNPHEWPASVEVTGTGQGGWVGLGTVERQVSHTFHEVLDHGDQWRFRFSYAGTPGADLTISRSELDQRDWTVTIPDAFGERMRAAGLAPSGG